MLIRCAQLSLTGAATRHSLSALRVNRLDGNARVSVLSRRGKEEQLGGPSSFVLKRLIAPNANETFNSTVYSLLNERFYANFRNCIRKS